MYFVFYGLHDTTLQICIISLYECFVNIMIVADIDDTEVIWIALLRHAIKNTGST